ncbi:chitinase N-terminal domain-containing protein [Chitinibacter sp. S2-10]|uniref:chitinase N-terminal domain-containing protein n=1 Tax=Chitinibacter sp. S2-10 TaxID=3373597 RepID=UPI003977C898
MRILFCCVLLLSMNVQAGLLLSASEAASREQLACQPTEILGVLECEQLPAPAAPVGNAPEIKAPEYVANSGDDIGAQATEAPMLPVLDPLPSRMQVGPLTVAWDIWFGTSALWWEVWDNEQLRYRGSDFSRRIKDAAVGVVSTSTQSDGAEIENVGVENQQQSVQSGVFQIAKIKPGEHQFAIRLCNGTLESPVCTEARASLWVDAGNDNAENGDTVGTQTPGAPALAWIPQVTTDGKVTVAWNLWWGQTGTHWEVLNHGKVIHRSDKFSEATETSQAGQVEVPLPNGEHQISVRLCSALKCSSSDTLKIDAMLGPDLSPAKPQLAVYTPEDVDLGGDILPSQILLSWKTTEPGIVPDRWLLIDSTSREVLFSQKIKVDCGNGIWCGSWQGVPATRPASWKIKLCQAKKCTDSDVIDVPGLEVEAKP